MAGQRRYRKLAILAKIETVYGTDATPVGATDALLTTNATLTPLNATPVSRALLLPYLGNQGVVLTGLYATLQFDVELAGSGAAGTAPAFGSLLRSSGFSEVLLATTSATYQPISDNFESSSIYFNSDGVKHVLLGARGTMTLSGVPKQIPKMTFTLTGLLGTITDTALPTVDVSHFQTPVPVSKADSTLTLQGWSAVAESLSIDVGNTVVPRFLIGDEAILITDRNVTGTAVVEARALATIDWFGKAKARTRGALAFAHGTVAGNIVNINGPAVEIGQPTQGQTDGIINYSLPLSFVPSAGNDELSLVFK
jgi:hypothetical protein